VQVNTTITRRNIHEVDEMADLLGGLGIVLWSVFFLVPVGRGRTEQRISADEYEKVFEKLWTQARRQPYGIKTTEAHHYRRYVLQRAGDPQRDPEQGAPNRIQRAPLGVNDGRGIMFISNIGQIYPSGFMPVLCGTFPEDSVVSVYQDNPIFNDLRNPSKLKGKCSACEYKEICSGSRARAYAVTGDPLGAEPDCAYIPVAWREALSQGPALPVASF
jgi:radical SAM protein with 4Fe4S-binding SPASM domain